MIKIKRTPVANKLNGISFHKVLFCTGSEAIIAAAHHISNRLDKFDQITFEISKSVSHFDDAIRLTNNSGADVQNAKIVNQIAIGGIQNFFATVVLHHTSISHHQIREISHKIIKKLAKKIHRDHWKMGLVILMVPQARIVRRRIKNGIMIEVT